MASIASYGDTAWNAAGTSFTSASVTWSAGDLVLAICGIEDAGATINTPTFSGGTFSPVDSNTAASTCNAKSFQCTPASGGSGTVNFTTSVSKQGGISVWVITSTSGLGDHKEQHTTTKTVASTRQGTAGPSIYVWCALDFAGDGVGAGSPTPTNTRRNVAANSDFLLCDLTGVSTNQSYGQDSTGGTAGPFTLLVMEAMDAAAAGSAAPSISIPNPFVGPQVLRQAMLEDRQVWVDSAPLGGIPQTFLQDVIADAVVVTASIQKQVNKTLTATSVVVTATIQALKVVLQALTATAVVVTALIQKQVNKTLTATSVAVTASIQKQVNKTLTASSVVVTASLQALKVVLKALTATAVVVTASIQKQVNKPLTATSVAVTASIQKQVNKTLRATNVVVTASLQSLKVIVKTLSATAVVVTATMQRQVQLHLSATSVVTGSIQKLVKKTLSASSTITATLDPLLGGITVFLTGAFDSLIHRSQSTKPADQEFTSDPDGNMGSSPHEGEFDP